MENSDIIQIHNAMMEIGYVNYSTSGTVGSSSQFDSNVLSNVGVSMVATTDTMGNLIFGISIFEVFILFTHMLLSLFNLQ